MIYRIIALLLGLLAAQFARAACEQTLNAGAAVGAAMVAATAGNEICLNGGNYPGWSISGTSKSPRVTVRALTPGAASFTGGIEFTGGANGFTIDGVNFTTVDITSANTRELTFRNFNQTGRFYIDGVTTATPNILLENFTQLNLDVADANPAGIAFSFSGRTTPVATIRNATIDGGCSDGIQSGVPFILENSRIMNKQVGACPNDPHTDAVQFYGGPYAGSIIRNNYFYRNVQVLAAFDGVDNVLIENNVFDPGPDGERRPCQIEWYSDTNSIIRHNTLLYRDSTYPGLICLDHKAGDPAGVGTQIIDNIAAGVALENGSTAGTRAGNLFRSGAVAGEAAGVPTYTGGTFPSTWAGFALSVGSLGKGAGTSPAGSDVGSNFFGAAPAAPVVTSALTKACTVGASCSYTIACSNSPDTFTATLLPDGLSFSSPTISGTPTTAGTVNTTIGCSNVTGSDSETLVYTIAAGGDTANPTVSISSPVGGTTVSGSAVNIAVNAADNVGVVGVQVRVDGVNVGAEDLTSPYAISWNSTTVANGSHVITAVARDAAGNTATSTGVTVNVNNVAPDVTPPVVSITTPSGGATVSSAISIAASCTDGGGMDRVQFRLDGANLGAADTSSPYSVTWDTTTASNGAHSLTAVCTDTSANSTTSSAVNVTVSNAVVAPAACPNIQVWVTN